MINQRCLALAGLSSSMPKTNQIFVKVNFAVEFSNDEHPPQKSGRRFNEKPVLRVKNEYGAGFDDGGRIQTKDGTVTSTMNFPYMAAVIINGRLWCAGTIVDENWIVTAAHCLN
jgi:V8-like Glu-specific endopeptidase